MKKLLFIGIVALMVQSLGAVTLPSTSYSPYAGGSVSTGTEQSLLSGGTIVTGSYSSLGAANGYEDVTQCTSETPDVPPKEETCENCCGKWVFDECINAKVDYVTCERLSGQCVTSCEAGGSLPLDGGLSILLILSLAGGAFKLYRAKGQGSSDK